MALEKFNRWKPWKIQFANNSQVTQSHCKGIFSSREFLRLFCADISYKNSHHPFLPCIIFLYLLIKCRASGHYKNSKTSFFSQPTPRASKIDQQVIDGHIIPNHVLFTAPTPSNKPYETLAFGDNLKVTISFSTEHSDKGSDKCEYSESSF